MTKIPMIPTNDTNSKLTTEESSNIPQQTVIGKLVNNDEGVDLGHRKNTKTKLTNKKRTNHALDKYIIFCFTVIIIYTIVHTIIFFKLGIEATVLNALFYGVFGGEVLLCALLKRLKLKQEHELVKKQLDDINIEEVTNEE